MLRVGIIGCGKVADKHASQILRIKGCEIVGVCDHEELMAGQLAERFKIKCIFTDVEELLRGCSPNVIHITTPPQTHFAIAKQCLESGCHIYVEKPFTTNHQQAIELIAISESSRLKLTVGHETQFQPVAVDMRKLIQSGYLGGPPVHMESIYCYDFSNESYAKALLGDRNHWVRRLPGGLLHNIISHGIGKIVEYLQGDTVTVHAHGFTSTFLETINEHHMLDELRVIIADNRKTTAYFTFSSQLSPPIHQFRVYGPKNSLIADHEHQTLIKASKKSYKSYLNQFIAPLDDGKQHIANGCRNVRRFLGNNFHSEYGIHYLIHSFYQSLIQNTSLPISYRDILMTSFIMNDIFSQTELSSADSPTH